MKQHITKEQLNELSEKAKERLRNWHHKMDRVALVSVAIDEGPEYPLLSIGQMIEFLCEHQQFYKEIQNYNDDHLKLCDSLWEAVKEVLEK